MVHALLSLAILCTLTISGSKASIDVDSPISTSQQHTENANAEPPVPVAHRRLSSSDYAGAKRSLGEIDKLRLGERVDRPTCESRCHSQVYLWA